MNEGTQSLAAVTDVGGILGASPHRLRRQEIQRAQVRSDMLQRTQRFMHALILHWVKIDSKQYHRDEFWRHVASAMDHLGFDLVPRATPQQAHEEQIAKRAAEDRTAKETP